MDKKTIRVKRIWSAIVRAVRENGDVNERRNMMQAKRGSYGPAQRF
ncbi:MAG: hypothetical protein WKF57_17875 [Nakamurella sp.]